MPVHQSNSGQGLQVKVMETVIEIIQHLMKTRIYYTKMTVEMATRMVREL